jgi:prolipoprotein diacylglyceryltransferase
MILVRFPWRKYPKGTITVLATCSYALLRFFIEYLRADGHVLLASLTVKQMQCMILISSSLLLPSMLRR